MTYTVTYQKGYVVFTDNANPPGSYSFNLAASTFQFTPTSLLVVRDGTNGVSFNLADLTNVSSLNQLFALIPEGGAVSSALDYYSDVFGRLRVSLPESLFSASEVSTLTGLTDVWQTAGTGTLTQVTYDSSVDISCTAGQTYVRQSRTYAPYQPGKSSLVKMTGVLRSTYTPLAIYRMGMFDSNVQKTNTNGFPDRGGDGHFFQYTNGVLSVVQRYSTNTGPNYQDELVVPQASWNVDKLDGTGKSAFNLDTTKANIYFIAREWLGVGEVVMGVVSNLKLMPCHVFYNSNVKSSTYMKTATLPVRYELDNTAGAGPAAMKIVCSCVESEGGYNPQGRIYSADLGVTSRQLQASHAELPVMCIRLKQNYGRIKVKPLSVGIISEDGNANNQIYFRLVQDATVVGGAWSDYSTANSAIQINTTATSITGGRTVSSSYVNANTTPAPIADYPDMPVMTADITGTSGTLVVAARHVDVGTRNVLCFMQWREFD